MDKKVSLRCWANEGHFFDQLLKQCMPCAELCGNHPAECAQICKAQPTAHSLTQLPRERAVIPVTITGGSLRGGEHHTVVIYSLLGLCLAALFCTLCTAVLVLLCKSRGCKAQAGHNKWGAHQAGPQEQETTDDSRCPSSKDRLMDVVVGEQGYESEEIKNAWPTETCMHCFPELRAQWRFEEKHPPPALCLQATGMAPSTGASTRLQHHQDTLTSENHHSLLHDPGVNDSGLGIICSPTQSG
ncbi:hypothetical protein GJAV_G00268550 [Gymnothorax javanicus]|nr:hypothetical protein GJAV_G00268550 [Gymnothorax javanicus]